MITLLYVDDEKDLLDIARLFLERSGDFKVTTSTSAKIALDSSSIGSYDLILSDYQMPDMDGITFLKEVRHRYRDIPFILFTGRGREEVVIEAINNGVDFYLQKGGAPTAQFAELSHKIRLAVERSRTTKALEESEEKYRSLVDLAPIAVLVHRKGKIIYANPESVRLSGASCAEDLIDREMLPLIHPDDHPITLEHFRQMSKGATIPLTEMRIFTIDGHLFTVEAAGKPINYEGLPAVIVVYRDITDRKKGEDELRAAYEQITASEEELRSNLDEIIKAQRDREKTEERYRNVIVHTPYGMHFYELKPDRGLVFVGANPGADRILGISHDRFIGKTIEEAFPGLAGTEIPERYREAAESGKVWQTEQVYYKEGSISGAYTVTAFRTAPGSMTAMFEDITNRKQTEKLLKDSEERSRRILERAPLPLAFVRNDGSVTFVNDRFVRVFGYTTDDIPTLAAWWQLAYPDPDYRQSVIQQWEEAVLRSREEHADIRPSEYRIICKNGEERIMQTSGITLSDGFLATFVDLTERKQTEEALLRKTEELDQYFNASLDLFCIAGTDGTFRRLNPEWEKTLGYSLTELEGHRFLDFVHPDDLPSTLAAIADLSHQKQVLNFTNRYRHKDGTYRWIEWRSFPSDDRIFAAARDITERKLTEEALHESEEKYRTLVEKANEAITILQDGYHVFVNSRMADLVGIPAKDLIGMSFLDLIWPEDRELMQTRYAQRCAGENVPETYDFRMTAPGGKPRWVSVSIAKIQWQGRPATHNLMTDITERKLAEDALRESERNYRNLVENSLSIIYTLLPDGTLTFISPSWKNHLGHELSEVLGRNFRLFVHPEDIAMCEAFLKKTADTGIVEVTGNDYRIFHKDGSIHWHRSSIMPVFDEKRNLLFFVGNAIDFTNRKHAEDALRESRAELSSILHGSPVLQFVIDRDHHILSWNKALEEYSGILAAEVIGTDRQWRAFYNEKRPVLADLLVDNNTDGLFKWYSGKLNPSRYVDGAFEATDFFPEMGESGKWLSFTAAPIRNANGEMIGAVETLEDVSEQIIVTEALRTSEEKYRRIMEKMQDAYIRTDENGIITVVNPSAARMYGYGTAEEMTGISSEALYATREQRVAMFRKLQVANGIIDFAGEALRKDGTTFPVSLNVQFILDEKGRVLGAEGIVRDITERKSMEHVIQEANRKLNLLNNITRHDIVNQLTMLQGFTQLAAMQESDPEVSEFLSKIDAGSETIRRQIEFMKSYQDLGVHTPGWFRLDETIQKAGREEVIFSDTCKDIEIFSDPMLEKVFFNLFDNAMKHGERVTEIVVRWERALDGIIIIVEDNGIGIQLGEKEKIFDKGFGKNTGLGLFLVKEILSITGITIRECGTPGKGAKFEIAVPKGHFRSVL